MHLLCNQSNLIARDTCAQFVTDTLSPGLAIGLAIIACAIFASIVYRQF